GAREAEPGVRAALAIDPQHQAAVRLLANLLKRRGNISEAAAILEPAADRDPPDAGIAVEVAYMLRQLGRIGEGETRLVRVLENAPAHVGALIALGHLRRSRGDRAGSLTAFRAASTAAPYDVNLRVDI